MCEVTQEQTVCLHVVFIQGDTAKAVRDLLAGGMILARHHAHQ
jgi:hypothetical protein